jgi:DHA1 family multidrug resistance protein-like MFS transporter
MPESAEPLPPPLKGIAVLQAAMNGAHFAAMPMLAVLVAQRVDGGPSAAGTALAIYFGLSRVGPIFLAPLMDRFGLWRGVSIGLCLRGIALAALPFVSHPTGAFAAAALLGLGQAMYEVSLYGVIGRQARARRDRLLVLNDQALNFGCVLGPLAGVALALRGADAAFVVAGGALFLLGLICSAVRSDLLCGRVVTADEGGMARMLRDSRFLVLCASLVPFWAVFAQLFAAFPLLAVTFGDSPAWANSILIVNGLAGIIALAGLGPWVERGRIHLILAIGLLLAFVSIAGTAFAADLWVLLAIVAAFSVGESSVMLAGQILTARHAEGRSATAYFGAFKASAGVGAAAGAYAGVLTADDGGGTGFVVLGAVGVLSLIGLITYVRMRPARRQVPA